MFFLYCLVQVLLFPNFGSMVTRGLYVDEDRDGFETIDILEQVRAVRFHPINGLLGYTTFLHVSSLASSFPDCLLLPLLSMLCPFPVELILSVPHNPPLSRKPFVSQYFPPCLCYCMKKNAAPIYRFVLAHILIPLDSTLRQDMSSDVFEF
jgi:hypothetical protein